MNKILFAFLMSSLLFVSCEKDELPVVGPTADDTKKEVEDNSTDIKGITVDDVEFMPTLKLTSDQYTEEDGSPLYFYSLIDENSDKDNPTQIHFRLDGFSKEENKTGEFTTGDISGKSINIIYAKNDQFYSSQTLLSDKEKINIADLGNGKFKVEFTNVVVYGADSKDSTEPNPNKKKIISGTYEAVFTKGDVDKYLFSSVTSKDSELNIEGENLSFNYFIKTEYKVPDSDPAQYSFSLLNSFDTQSLDFYSIAMAFTNKVSKDELYGQYSTSAFSDKYVSVAYIISGKVYASDYFSTTEFVTVTDLGDDKYRLDFERLVLYSDSDKEDKKVLTGSLEGTFIIQKEPLPQPQN